MMRHILRLLRRQDGISLVMAVGILGVLSASGTTLIFSANSNGRSAEFSKDNESAYSLAEAGINEMMAVLSNPNNNALKADLLPQTTSAYSEGTVTWLGTLNAATQTWSLRSTGRITNPTGPNTNDVTRVLTASVRVLPTYTQKLNNPAWNYIFATRTGTGGCDQTLDNNVGGGTRIYTAGNLCLSNNAQISTSPLIVQGKLWLDNGTTKVGTSTSRIEAYVKLGCKKGSLSPTPPAVIAPCPGDSQDIYSKLANGSPGVSSDPPVIAAPVADWAWWYANAMPGPALACTSSSGAALGSVPTFDGNTIRDNSVPGVFDLTPASDYTCRVGPARSPSGCVPPPAPSGSIECEEYPVGELSWKASTKTLTANGTIFIDGSAYVSNGALNQYNGQATVYLSGTLYVNGKLCGGTNGSSCDFANWNPNTELLVFAADQSSPGGIANKPAAGYGVELTNGSEFQGGLFATAAINLLQNAKTDGPMVASYITMSNNVQGSDFPLITNSPAGMPGNPAVYAQPNSPELYSG